MGRHKPRKGRAAKKARAGALNAEDEYAKCPHTFVFNRNQVGKNVKQLIKDMKEVMEPFTASKLKARRTNRLKDFVSIASMWNVSHFMMFTKTKVGIYMKLARAPHGPTLTYKVSSYTPRANVISSLKRPHIDPKQNEHHPLIVLNNFGGEGLSHKLMASMWQNMFPSFHLKKANLNNCKRCVVLNYNSEDKSIDFRHYNFLKAGKVKVPSLRSIGRLFQATGPATEKPPIFIVCRVGLSRGVKKIIRSKVPNLARYSDISEYVMRDGNLSESEAELDGPLNEVTLPQHISGRGNMKSAKSAIRLTEIGPRMTLKLIKIQEGLSNGEVLFHDFIQKEQKGPGNKNKKQKKSNSENETETNDDETDSENENDEDSENETDEKEMDEDDESEESA